LINKKGYKHLHKYCFFCGENDYAALNCHRIVPGEHGGTYHAHNTLTVCASCHSKIHAGRIIIDKKYKQISNSSYMVHYWLNEKEFWKSEDVGIFKESEDNDLGKSKTVN